MGDLPPAGAAFGVTLLFALLLVVLDARRLGAQTRLVTLARRAADEHRWKAAVRTGRLLEKGYPKVALLGTHCRAHGQDGLGDFSEAVETARLLQRHSPNVAVCLLVSAGDYARALEVAREAVRPPVKLHWTTGPRRAEVALIRINASEALYNLGRWDEAWRELEPLDEDAGCWPLTHDGLWIQRAWILAHTGRPADAMAALERADANGIPPPYRPETQYARGACLLAAGRPAEAREAIDQGLGLVLRASSERNGLFMLARVAAAREDWEEAERLCRTAAAHRYVWQGGDGLVRWGDALARLGREGEAHAAWRLACERDPQSEAAAFAAERLRARPG